MAAVRQRNTAPEILVRSVAHNLGLRFALHRKDLPGSPDVVFPKHRVCIFVHGCFWHRHSGCHKTTTPSANRTFWLAKFKANVSRDRRALIALRTLGWRPIVIWECEAKEPAVLSRQLRRAFAMRARSRSQRARAG